MKPVKITIEGINSFIERQALDFEAAGRSNLFCISGKTGAGKTTIFDSIMLALYGRAAKGSLADVINLSLKSARVVFEFTDGGDRYEVERVIKRGKDKKDESGRVVRTASAECKLAKNGVPFAVGEAATEILRNIVGLDAAEFKNVYLLEQGEYAEFLKKSPAKQTEAVGKIFSLMRFGDVHRLAGERQKDIQKEIGFKSEALEKLGDATPEKLKAKKDELKALKTKLAALNRDCAKQSEEIAALAKLRDEFITVREKQKAVAQLMIGLDEARAAALTAKKSLDEFEAGASNEDSEQLVKLRERQSELSALNELDRQYSSAVSEREKRKAKAAAKRDELTKALAEQSSLEKAIEAVRAEFEQTASRFLSLADGVSPQSAVLSRAAEKLKSLPDSSALTEIKAELSAELNAYRSLLTRRDMAAKNFEKLRADNDTLLDKIEMYVTSLAEADSELAAAQEGEQNARRAVEKAQLNSYAAAVRAELSAGDICPVCGGVVGDHAPECSAQLDEAKAALNNATERLKKAQDARTKLSEYLTSAKSEQSAKSKQAEAARAELDELSSQMAATCVQPQAYDELIEIVEKCKACVQKLEKSERDKSARLPEQARLKAECEAEEKSAQECDARAKALAERLGEWLGKTAGEIEHVKQLIEQTEQRISAVEQKRKKLQAELSAAEGRVSAAESALDVARRDCPVDSPEFDEEGYTQKRDALDRLKAQIGETETQIAVMESEIERLDKDVAGATSLSAEIAALRERENALSVIQSLTHGKAMLNFVAAEYIEDFTAEASEILSELSSGKYTMAYDKNNGFVVADYLNNGLARKTDTLSGGELFLASLAVAIAIAHTQSAGNNAFFFLDEGFGTLDEELIDVVYGALESLSKDCLVGVITHAEALIARMPACVKVVEANDERGSQIVF